MALGGAWRLCIHEILQNPNAPHDNSMTVVVVFGVQERAQLSRVKTKCCMKQQVLATYAGRTFDLGDAVAAGTLLSST